MPPPEQPPNQRQNAASRVHVKGWPLGPFATNCYVVWEGTSAPGTPCWIVDASFEPGPLIEFVRAQWLVPEALVLTHAHVDHIAGLDEVIRAFPGTPVMMHDAERQWLDDPMLNLSGVFGVPVAVGGGKGPDRLLEDGQTLSLGGSTWRVLHTPGHSPGGITLSCAESQLAIVGDSLFAGSVGRTDFPGSDFDTLAQSIRQKLYTLPDATAVYPGHGPATTIGREKASNPFVRP